VLLRVRFGRPADDDGIKLRSAGEDENLNLKLQTVNIHSIYGLVRWTGDAELWSCNSMIQRQNYKRACHVVGWMNH
jgi:hypothetical protein